MHYSLSQRLSRRFRTSESGLPPCRLLRPTAFPIRGTRKSRASYVIRPVLVTGYLHSSGLAAARSATIRLLPRQSAQDAIATGNTRLPNTLRRQLQSRDTNQGHARSSFFTQSMRRRSAPIVIRHRLHYYRLQAKRRAGIVMTITTLQGAAVRRAIRSHNQRRHTRTSRHRTSGAMRVTHPLQSRG